MANPIDPQEVWLLELYSSGAYFERIAANLDAALDIAEDALEAFCSKLAPDYRNTPLSEQVDIVWGERVLPNFRTTADAIHEGLQRLQSGDPEGLGFASNMRSAYAAYGRDYGSDWMSAPAITSRRPHAADEFEAALAAANRAALNAASTYHAWWDVASLRGALAPDRDVSSVPVQLPSYRRMDDVQVTTGDLIPRTGIYVPAAENAAAQFLIEGRAAPKAASGYDEERQAPRQRLDSRWTLIVRDETEQAVPPGSASSSQAQRLEAYAGQPCPRTGWWRTVARLGDRRHVERGKPMPDIQSRTHGVIIWYFDDDQRDTP
ncbi:MAG TPA: hypothetical protein VFK82_07650 [Burkholderiaceae bacterium]|nr:hypothetical protein [Burkholderiaceae bacterium]